MFLKAFDDRNTSSLNKLHKIGILSITSHCKSFFSTLQDIVNSLHAFSDQLNILICLDSVQQNIENSIINKKLKLGKSGSTTWIADSIQAFFPDLTF